MIIGWIFTICFIIWLFGLAIYGVYLFNKCDNDDNWPTIDQDTLITIIGASA